MVGGQVVGGGDPSRGIDPSLSDNSGTRLGCLRSISLLVFGCQMASSKLLFLPQRGSWSRDVRVDRYH